MKTKYGKKFIEYIDRLIESHESTLREIAVEFINLKFNQNPSYEQHLLDQVRETRKQIVRLEEDKRDVIYVEMFISKELEQSIGYKRPKGRIGL